jgi:GNAT superfamily N-acetyltransferase
MTAVIDILGLMTIVIEETCTAARPAPGPAPEPAPLPQSGPAVRMADATSQDTEAVLAMLARCSRESLYHRFHGYTDGVAFTRASLGRPNDKTLLAWDRAECIGVATIGWDQHGEGHLGVLVEDRWQRRGLGTTLIRDLVDTARSRGMAQLHADILGEDGYILRILRRVGTLSVAIALGTFSVDLDLT